MSHATTRLDVFGRVVVSRPAIFFSQKPSVCLIGYPSFYFCSCHDSFTSSCQEFLNWLLLENLDVCLIQYTKLYDFRTQGNLLKEIHMQESVAYLRLRQVSLSQLLQSLNQVRSNFFKNTVPPGFDLLDICAIIIRGVELFNFT